MSQVALIPIAIAVLFGGTFIANEWSHGGVSEAVGNGHRHMFDYGGYHCANHNGTGLTPAHMTHMHDNGSMPHDACRGDGNMHQNNQDTRDMMGGRL